MDWNKIFNAEELTTMAAAIPSLVAGLFVSIEASKLALDRARIQILCRHLQLFIDDVEDRVGETALGLMAAHAGGGHAA
jgi:hypothetical protein